MSKTIVPHRAEFNVGEYVMGDLKVVSSLGEGSYGHVYKVQSADGTIYALKILRLWEIPSEIRQDVIDHFEMEFKTGQIASRYLVHSLNYGFIKGNPYILMEYCPGGDLSSLVGKQDIDVPSIASNILHGLNALHDCGKVHRDLKPENVLFKSNGTAALTDFGIAGDRNKRMTERNIFGKPNQIFGTYGYMPPEQVNPPFLGKATVLPTTDIYSFGVLIFQILTGKLPFGKLDNQNDLVCYLSKGKKGDWDRETLMQVPKGYLWERLIEGCLQPKYEKRLQNVREVHNLIPFYKIRLTPIKTEVEVPTNGKRSMRLVIMDGEGYGKTFDLTAIARKGQNVIVTIGRNSDSYIQLGDLYVSRHHSTLELHNDNGQLFWRILDGQMVGGLWTLSSNGVYVNSSKVKPCGFWLKHGDIITIGETKLKFEQY